MEERILKIDITKLPEGVSTEQFRQCWELILDSAPLSFYVDPIVTYERALIEQITQDLYQAVQQGKCRLSTYIKLDKALHE